MMVTSTGAAGGNPADPYFRSYLVIRTAVGVMGILLPAVLILGEALLRGPVQVRGSLSAYYHTSVRDFFVCILCVTGVLLITYLAGNRGTLAYWVSSVAGVAVLGVAFIPTGRPDLPPGAVPCGHASLPAPAGCTAVQQRLGETLAATIHFGCAAVFIVSLAVMSYLFTTPRKVVGLNPGKPSKRALHYSCSTVIGLAVVLVAIGSPLKWHIWILTPLYVAEVASVLAFAASWLAEGEDLRGLLPMPLRRSLNPT
jgi:hypothetical protein